jgi:hypothetical protein
MGTNETHPESNSPRGDINLHREMREQSLRVPWFEVAAAIERLLAWRSLTLWARAIIDAERALPAWIPAVIEERCPGFLQSRRGDANLESLWLDLSEWIDNHFFASARDNGWIQALHFYSGRAPESENIWRHWTRMEAEWRRHRPAQYPSFEEWHKDAVRITPPSVDEGASADSPGAGSLLAALSAQYLEWEAFSFWVRCVVEGAHEIPSLVATELERRCPGFIAHARTERAKPCADPQWLWRELLEWIEGHTFADAQRGSLIEDLRDAARSNLRAERIVEYRVACSLKWGKQLPGMFPNFEQWLAEADAFVAV